jgi:ATP-dependent Clp protease ATP-binding subunit ClpA
MEKAHAKLANGTDLDFSDCVIAFTANSGSHLYERKSMGLTKEKLKSDFSLRKELLREFSSPFLNRIKDIWLFSDYNQEQKMLAIEIQVKKLLDGYGTYKSGIFVEDCFYQEAVSIKLDKTFGMRDLIRTVKSVVETRCLDLAFGRTKSKIIMGKDIVAYLKVQHESNQSIRASV